MQGAFGERDRVHFLMFECFIPMHQVIFRPRLLPFFIDKSLRRSVNMEIVFVLLNVNPLLHLYVFSTFGIPVVD